MKACKFYTSLFILIFFSFQVLALDCNQESDFVISNDHWLRDESAGLQVYVIGHLSTKILSKCLNEDYPKERLHMLNVLIEIIGEDKLKALETEFNYMFDLSDALKELEIDIFDDNTRKEIDAFTLKYFTPHQ